MIDRADAARRPSRGLLVVRNVGVATAYFAAAKLGLTMAFAADQVSPVWPPTGIAFAAVLLLGPAIWPGIALGAFLANATANEPLGTAAGIALGNTLEALTGGGLLRRLAVRTSLDGLRDVLALLVAACFSTAIAATIGVASLCLGDVHPWTAFGSLWAVWWIGDAMGALVMAPVLLAWASSPLPRPGWRRLTEAAALAVAALGLSFIVFAGRLGMRATGYPLHYMIFPLVVWAALRFGQRGATAVTFCASAVAIWSTINGWGPFAAGTVNESLVELQLFMAVVAGTALLLGGAISERNRAERRRALEYARVEVSEQRLRVALEAGRMGVWDWNVATGQVTWSENLEPIHGLSSGGFPGTLDGFLALVHTEDRELVRAALTRALAEGVDYDLEFRNLWPDGSVHWMATKGTVLRDAAGRPLRMIGVGTEITERRRLQEALKQRADALAESDRQKDEFLAMLAHELRNPLSSLATAVHALGLEGTSHERLLQIANRQVRQLGRLVEDLLDVARITQGKIVLRPEPLLLGDEITRAIELSRAILDARGHVVTVSLPPTPVHLEADPARLAQVLGNLLTNAAKYTPAGGAIRVTGERVGEEAVIRVRDTGAGLSPALLPRIFDLFVQGDTALDRARGGLGIGLTIVRRLVELHGGRVEAHSEGPGHGSEFVVRLPVAPAAPEGTAEEGGRGDGSSRAGLRVLLVEDNFDAAEGLATVLRTWGHEVYFATDGAEALEVVDREQPDVVLSDLGLPRMDGYELARRVRARPGGEHVVLVALSGYGQEEDRRQSRAAGFDDHLVKPADMEALAELLRRAATRARVPGWAGARST